MHQILKLKCFSALLAVVFAPYIEAKCWVENEDVVGAAPVWNSADRRCSNYIWVINNSIAY